MAGHERRVVRVGLRVRAENMRDMPAVRDGRGGCLPRHPEPGIGAKVSLTPGDLIFSGDPGRPGGLSDRLPNFYSGDPGRPGGLSDRLPNLYRSRRTSYDDNSAQIRHKIAVKCFRQNMLRRLRIRKLILSHCSRVSYDEKHDKNDKT